jgi:hypothetical protein
MSMVLVVSATALVGLSVLLTWPRCKRVLLWISYCQQYQRRLDAAQQESNRLRECYNGAAQELEEAEARYEHSQGVVAEMALSRLRFSVNTWRSRLQAALQEEREAESHMRDILKAAPKGGWRPSHRRSAQRMVAGVAQPAPRRIHYADLA